MRDIAAFTYSTSPRPAPSTAIASALVLLAAIAGGSYTFRDSHLPVFVAVVAEPGAGADGARLGINRILSALALTRPTVDKIECAPPLKNAATSLRRHLNQHRRSMFWASPEPHIAVIEGREIPTHRRLAADLFSRARPGDRLAGEDGEGAVTAPCLSILSTCYPSQYSPRINPQNLEDGLAGRFLTLTHQGKPPRNVSPQVTPPPEMIGNLTSLLDAADSLLSAGRAIPVEIEPAAAAILDAFEAEMDGQNGPIFAHRALIAGRIAALCAVGRSPWEPVIDVADIVWAVKVVQQDAAKMEAALAHNSTK